MNKLIDFIAHNFLVKALGIIFFTIISYGLLINNLNLWSDELYSVLMANDSLSDMWKLLTTEDSKPPLYYLYLKFVLCIFPKEFEIWGTHFASYILLIGAQIFALTAIRKDYGDKVSLWMIAILMLHPISLWLAFEARTYMLSSFLLLVCLVYGLRLTREPKNIDFVKFGIACLLGLYSHYYVAICLMFLYIMILFLLIYDKTFEKFGKKFIITSICVALLFLPWIFVPLSTGEKISQYWYVTNDFVRFSVRFFTEPLQPEILQSIFFIATTFSASVFSFIVLCGCFNTAYFSHRLKRAFVICILCFILSYILLVILSYAIRPMVTARYLKIFTLLMYFGGAITIANMPSLKKAILSTLLIGFCFTYVDIKAISFDEAYTKAKNEINQYIPENMTILALDNANLFCEYYLPNHKCILAVGSYGEILRTPSLLKNINLYYKKIDTDIFVLSIYSEVSDNCKVYESWYRNGANIYLCRMDKNKAQKLIDDSLNLRLNKYLNS